MRTLSKNKQKFCYTLCKGRVPVYEYDEDGNVKYIDIDGKSVPVETGDSELAYDVPMPFYSSISMSGSNAEAVEFGLSVSDYAAVLITQKGAYPIEEGTLIWHKSEVEYTSSGLPKPSSADYMVLKVSESLNLTKYVLKALVK